MNPRPYDNLTPDTVLDAVESIGLVTDGRQLALNSFENRVYQVGLDETEPVVVKFYRPQRWSDAAIEEEHQFGLALAKQDIPVVPPMVLNQRTLHRFNDFRFSVSARQGGREPELESSNNLQWFGRVLGRIHQVGSQTQLSHRNSLLDFERVQRAVAFLFDSQFVPFELKGRYKQITDVLLSKIQPAVERSDIRVIAVHGDCHRGNVLWTDSGPHFVDLDDCCTGPAVADFWMLLDGDAERRRGQLDDLLEGYEQFREFDYRELHLIEPLKAMRMMEYAAWVARRWEDPAFPRNFAWFAEPRYWEDYIQGLGEQLQRLETN